MTRKIGFLAVALMALARPVLATDTTQEIWTHHINAWNARDLDGIVSDYTEGAAVVMNNKVYRGTSEIRLLFNHLFKAFDQAKEHHIDPAVVTGKIVYITWNAKMGGVRYTVGTDTFVIDGGRIEYQTIFSNPQF